MYCRSELRPRIKDAINLLNHAFSLLKYLNENTVKVQLTNMEAGHMCICCTCRMQLNKTNEKV